MGTNQIARRPVDPHDLGLPSGQVSSLADVQKALNVSRGRGYHLLAPPTLNYIPPGYVVAFRAVAFDPNQDFYNAGGKYALYGHALAMLMSTAEISTVTEKCFRVDDGSDPYYWEYRMTVRMVGFDGREREITATRPVDLRDGSPEAAEALGRDGKNHSALAKKRQFGPMLAESKALNRCLRKALGLRSYLRDELANPFVIPVLLPFVDMSDPEIRRMAAAKALGIAHEVYGGGRSATSYTPTIDARDSEAPGSKAPPPVGQIPQDDGIPWEDESREREHAPVGNAEGPIDVPAEGPDFDPSAYDKAIREASGGAIGLDTAHRWLAMQNDPPPAMWDDANRRRFLADLRKGLGVEIAEWAAKADL